jgi:dolichol-phosphate mannosyltransferase
VDISIIVPVFNEAENILPLLAEIHAVLEGQGEFEVVYVDDGSSDATLARLAGSRRSRPTTRVGFRCSSTT